MRARLDLFGVAVLAAVVGLAGGAQRHLPDRVRSPRQRHRLPTAHAHRRDRAARPSRRVVQPGGTGPAHGAAYAFPAAADLRARAPSALRALGFSSRKAEFLLGLSDLVTDGALDLEAVTAAGDDTVSASLQSLRGIGPSSAEYALLRGLRRLGVFPGDDVGARNNLGHRLGLAAPLDYDGVRRAVAPWAPYAGLAYFHLLVERIEDAGWLVTPA